MRKKLFFIAFMFLFANAGAQQWSPITNNNIWSLNSGNVGIGLNNPKTKLEIKGEFCSNLTGISNLRLIGGKYATLFRSDGADTYFLLTNKYDIYGGWNGLRPFRINNLKGDVYLANSNLFVSHSSGDVGIGTTHPRAKLDVNGKLLLRTYDVERAVRMKAKSYLNWEGHALIMGNLPGTYAHSSVELKPGGSSQGTLFSSLRMYTALSRTQHKLKIQFNTAGNSFINNDGNLGIGYENPTAKLDVNGTVRAKEVKVCLDQGCDFVFEDNYDLMPINKLNKFIKKNKHLPNIAPAKEMEKNGIDLSKMNAQLLRKVEELTLYIIEQERRIKKLEEKVK